MLRIPEPPNLELLREAVTPELADYRVWREDVLPGREYDPPRPVIRHVLQRWIIPRGVSLAEARLHRVLEHEGRWHLQIAVGTQLEYYARAVYGSGTWQMEWFGEPWLAEPVQKGIDWLNDRDEELEAEVRFLSSRLYHFSAFWLHDQNEYLVVSARDGSKRFLPVLNRLLSESELQDALLEHFGPNHGASGIDSNGAVAT